MTKTYTKRTWLDEILAANPKYQIKDDAGNIVYHFSQIDLSTDVNQTGTSVNAANLNNIENGVDGLDTQVNQDGIPILRETSGPTALALGSIPDGYFGRRSGNTFIGDIPASQFVATNNSAITLTTGMVVVFDNAHEESTKTTTTQGDVSVIGVAMQTIAVGASGRFAVAGKQTVAVRGNVAVGNWLVASSTPGYAVDSGMKQRPTHGAVGMAVTSFTGTTGTVLALLDIPPYSSIGAVSLLSTITSASASAVGNPASISFSHTIDAGTDLVNVLLFTSGNSVPSYTQCLANGTLMNLIGYATNGYSGVAAYQLRITPPTTSQNITIVASGTEWYNNVSAVAFNVQGSQSTTPIRNFLFNTVQSHSHAANTGDMIIDFINVTGTETPGSGQTIIASSVPSNHLYTAKFTVTDGGTIVLTWTGSTTGLVHGSFVIAGS